MPKHLLSTHVLDTSTGSPGNAIHVELLKQKGEDWIQWHATFTSSDGRIEFPFSEDSMSVGTYKLKFHVGDYYKKQNKETLYPYVEVAFKTQEGQKYHIPLLLSPYGYSTYRGS